MEWVKKIDIQNILAKSLKEKQLIIKINEVARWKNKERQ